MRISFRKHNREVIVDSDYEDRPIVPAGGKHGVKCYHYAKDFGLDFIGKYKFLDRLKNLGYTGKERFVVKAIHRLDERDVRKNNKNEFLSFVGNVVAIDKYGAFLGLPLRGVDSTLVLDRSDDLVLGELYRIDLGFAPIPEKKAVKGEKKLLME